MSIVTKVRRWYNQLPHAGSPVGDQVRDAFIANFYATVGGEGLVRLLWLPKIGNTTTTTSEERNASIFTYDATIAARISRLGSGVAVDFDGTDDEADTPSSTAFNFGTGLTDEPFSVIAVCIPDVNNAAMTLLGKLSSATAEQWEFGLNASGHPVLTLTDESASATLTGTHAVAAGTAAVLLASSYNGTRASVGIKIYKNGLVVATTAGGTGTYVAMEKLTPLVHLGARYTTKEQFFNGKLALVALVAAELDADQHFALKALVNSFFDLTL